MLTKQDILSIRKTLKTTRDPSLEVFKIRDYQEIKDAGLYDLVWSLCRADSYCHRNDVIGLLDLLEEWMDAQVCRDCDIVKNPSCNNCLGS